MYNVKAKYYKQEEMQLRIYSYPVRENYKLTEREKERIKRAKELRKQKENKSKKIKLDEPLILDGVLYTEWEINDNEIFNRDVLERNRKEREENSIRSSINRTKNKIIDLCRANNWEYFLTLTFAPDKVDRYDYSECSKKLSQWLKDFKKLYCNDLKYVVVPEQHKDGAWHFHALVSNLNIKLKESGLTDKKGNEVYNLPYYHYGFTTATEVKDTNKASNYILKYITKDLCSVTRGKKRYWASKNLDKPIIHTEFVQEKEKSELLSDLQSTYKKTYYKQLNYNINNMDCKQDIYEFLL